MHCYVLYLGWNCLTGYWEHIEPDWDLDFDAGYEDEDDSDQIEELE